MHAPASWCQVYVATIHPTHYAITKMALEAGKSCMVEKPFGMNAREASELAELAKVKGVFLMEAMWTACLPATIEALVNPQAKGKLLAMPLASRPKTLEWGGTPLSASIWPNPSEGSGLGYVQQVYDHGAAWAP